MRGQKIVCFDGKHGPCAIKFAEAANGMGIPTLIDAEDACIPLAQFSDLLHACEFVKCGETFPSTFTGKADMLEANEELLRRCMRNQDRKWVITTLGAKGSLLMQRQKPKDVDEIKVVVVANHVQLLEMVEKMPKNGAISYFKYQSPSDRVAWITYCSAFFVQLQEIVDTTGKCKLSRMFFVLLSGSFGKN